MAISFPQLTKKTVHIGIGDGAWIEVPMLTLEDYLRFRELQKEISRMPDSSTQQEQAEKLAEARAEMMTMAKKVLPESIRENVYRLDFVQLTSLVLVLCSGNDDAEGDDPEKKREL
jgi:hypothetical protein